jgi:hypothetical protein
MEETKNPEFIFWDLSSFNLSCLRTYPVQQPANEFAFSRAFMMRQFFYIRGGTKLKPVTSNLAQLIVPLQAQRVPQTQDGRVLGLIHLHTHWGRACFPKSANLRQDVQSFSFWGYSASLLQICSRPC